LNIPRLLNNKTVMFFLSRDPANEIENLRRTQTTSPRMSSFICENLLAESKDFKKSQWVEIPY
jgi:hypothetical protein